MDIEAVWGSYMLIIGALGGLSSLLSKALNEETQRRLSCWLEEQVAREPATWVQAANRAFVQFFDWLFDSRKTSWEGSLWYALTVSPVLLVLARLALLVGGVQVGDATDLLLFALWLTFAFAIFLRTTEVKSGLGFGVGIVAFLLVTVGGPLAFVTLGSIFIGLSVGLFVGTFFGVYLSMSGAGIGFALAFGFSYWSAIGGIILLVLESLTGFGSYAFAFGAIGFGLGLHRGAGYILGPGLAAPASPLRILAYSLFSLGVVSLFRLDAAISFVEAIRTDGPKVLVFLAFSMFADCFSFLETRWVLRRGIDSPTLKLLALLVLDLVLSAAIFLALPLILWEIPSFIDAALFHGDRQWLGVMFWSTFSTSVTFYVFVLSSLLIRPLAHAPRLARYLAIQTRPVLILAIALGMGITLTYAVGIGVAAAILFFR